NRLRPGCLHRGASAETRRWQPRAHRRVRTLDPAMERGDGVLCDHRRYGLSTACPGRGSGTLFTFCHGCADATSLGHRHAIHLYSEENQGNHRRRGISPLVELLEWQAMTRNPAVPSANDVTLAFEDLAVGYGETPLLQGINIQVRPGQVVTIMGGSGTGKTTLLRAATGQLAAQKGKVLVFGRDLAQVSHPELLALRQRMGVLF